MVGTTIANTSGHDGLQLQLSLDSLDASACGERTAINDPLVSSGGVYYPPDFQVRPDGFASRGALQLASLSNDGLIFLDIHTGLFKSIGNFSDQEARLVTLLPKEKERATLVVSDGVYSSRFIDINVLSNEPSGRTTISAHGVLEAVRYGDTIYTLASGLAGGVVRLFNARTRKIVRELPLLANREAVPRCIAIGSAVLYVFLEQRTSDSARMASRCDMLVLERHSQRSVALFPAIAASCVAVAPHGTDLLLLESREGPLRRIPATALVRDTRAATQHVPFETLWRCGHGCMGLGLAVDNDRAFLAIAKGVAGLYSDVIALNLSTSGSLQAQLMAQVPGRVHRLVAPAYLETASAKTLLPLRDKAVMTRYYHMRRALVGRKLTEHPTWPRVVNGHKRVAHVIHGDNAPHRRQLTASHAIETQTSAADIEAFRTIGAVDVAPMRAALLREWTFLWGADGRSPQQDFKFLFPGLQNIQRQFPGVLNAKLLFSGIRVGSRSKVKQNSTLLPKLDFSGKEPPETCIVLPAWRRFAPQVLPLLEEVLHHTLGLSNLSRNVWRVQLNRMPPNSSISAHIDQGSYAERSHRVHVPIIVPRCIRFEQHSRAERSKQSATATTDWSEVPMKEGEAFEVNNRIMHRVSLSGPHERLTLLIDVAEMPCTRYVEVSSHCKGWEDPHCIIDTHVDEAEWRADAQSIRQDNL